MKISNTYEQHSIDPAKEAAREQFERSSGVQDRHTGKASESGKNNRQNKKVTKEMKREYVDEQDEKFAAHQIEMGINAWEDGGYLPHLDDGVSFRERDPNWRETLKKISDTSFEEAMNYVDSNLSQEDYVQMQEEARKQLEKDKKEAWEERKRKNFSKTGDPYGDRNRTSLVH